jgi:uncharacterized repeat protein (TIGR01451 family)
MGTGASITYPVPYGPPLPGIPGASHQVTYRITDSFGNVSEASIYLVINDPPTLAFTPGEGSFVLNGQTATFSASGTAAVTGNAIAPATMVWYLDGVASWGKTGGTITVDPVDWGGVGWHAVRVMGTDAFGTVGSVTHSIYYGGLTITASAGANGNISPVALVTLVQGSSQAFTITPDLGYHVLDVLVDGFSVGAVTSYTFSSVAVNHTISATFTIDTYTISGNAGVANALLTYTGGTTTADSAGAYTISVAYNWSGTVTPSLAGYTFTPANRTYSNLLANQTAQHYTAIPNPAPSAPFLLLLATGTGGSTGGSFTPGSPWTAASIAAASADAPGLAVTDAGLGVGVMRELNGNALLYTTWGGTSWSVPAAIAAGLTARSRPAVCSNGNSAALAFQQGDFKYYYAGFSSIWSPTAEAVGSPQPCGPTGPDIAVVGTTPTLSFVNGPCGGPSNHLVGLDRTLGAWNPMVDLGSQASLTIPPSLAAPSSGPELLAVFVNGTQVMSCARTGGTWSAPAAIPNLLTNDRVALAPTASGGVVLAYRGTDGKLYWSVYSGGNWSSPAALCSPNVSTLTTPAVARGIATADAELAYVGMDGFAYHSRLIGGAWTVPVQVGGTAVSGVAIASFAGSNYTISGNAGVAGATLNYTDGSPKTATADGSGAYSFTVSYNWSGTVTPSKTGYSFSPTSTSYTNVLTNQTAQDFTASLMLFTIHGNAGVAGATINYTAGGGGATTADGAGDYSFTVPYGDTGTFTPSKAGYTFTPVFGVYSPSSYLGLNFSATLHAPDLSTSIKTVTNLTSGAATAIPGDILQYTVTVTNTGNDTAVATVLTDPLPAKVTYVPGSLQINSGAKTDAAGDDQAEYLAGTHSVAFRLGTGATGAMGGTLAIGPSTTLTFRVTVNASATGVVSNQATVSAAGELGAPQASWGTLRAPGVPGPTVISIPTPPAQANAWSENAGWINFFPTHGTVTASLGANANLSGFAWGENLGWIRFAAASAVAPYLNTTASNWGVNVDVSGNLSGYAWSENAGWINFGATDANAKLDLATGALSGYAWGENVGWVHLAGTSYGVQFLP